MQARNLEQLPIAELVELIEQLDSARQRVEAILAQRIGDELTELGNICHRSHLQHSSVEMARATTRQA